MQRVLQWFTPILLILGSAYAESMTFDTFLANHDKEDRYYDSAYCPPKNDYCSYQGRSYTREELMDVIPKVRSEYCDDMLCYTPDFQHIIGINPDRPVIRKRQWK